MSVTLNQTNALFFMRRFIHDVRSHPDHEKLVSEDERLNAVQQAHIIVSTPTSVDNHSFIHLQLLNGSRTLSNNIPFGEP